MEVIKRKICIEPSIDRSYNSKTYCAITATSFYIKVFLTQTIDNMGLFTDTEYISAVNNPITPDYTPLIDKLTLSGITSPFMTGGTPNTLITGNSIYFRSTGGTKEDYYAIGGLKITGLTDSKIEDVRSYDNNNPYKVGFNINTENYLNFSGESISGVSRITQVGSATTYTFDAKDNIYLGTTAQTTGLLYTDYSGVTRTINNGDTSNDIPLTTFQFVGEGLNETNLSLSALTKEEYLFGIVNKQETQSDIFIDRSQNSVFDVHLRLSEINNIDDLEKYGNGFYNIKK